MSTAIKLGLLLAVLLAVSRFVTPESWGPAILLGFVAVLSVVHAVIAWKRAKLKLFSYSLAVNSVSAALLAVVFVFQAELSRAWMLGLGAAFVLGLVASAFLARWQFRARPSEWRTLKARLEAASLVDVLLGRPLGP